MTALSALADRLVGRLERATFLDKAAEPVATVVQSALRSKLIRDLASGTPSGHPAHPPLVALPIGSFVTASALDLSGPEHLLIGLLRLGEKKVSALLAHFRVEPSELRDELMMKIFNQMTAPRPPGAEVHIWGALEDVEALFAVAKRLGRPLDDLVWEAVRRVWLQPPEDAAT